MAFCAALVCAGPGGASENTAANIAARFLVLDGAVVGREVIAVGERGAIIRSANLGRSWQASRSPSRATLTGVSFAPANPPRNGWAVGHDAQILASSDGGRTWARQYQGENLQDSFLDVLAVDERRVIAVGAYGLFVDTTDGGQTWRHRKLGQDDFHFNRISRGPSGTLYLAGEHGTLLRSVDAGENWSPMASPYEGSFYGVIALEERTLLAHGLRGRIYRSVDDGQTWDLIPTTEPRLLATAVRTRGGRIVFAGQARTLLTSSDAGKSVQSEPAPLPTAIAELLELPDGSLLALGEAGAILLPQP